MSWEKQGVRGTWRTRQLPFGPLPSPSCVLQDGLDLWAVPLRDGSLVPGNHASSGNYLLTTPLRANYAFCFSASLTLATVSKSIRRSLSPPATVVVRSTRTLQPFGSNLARARCCADFSDYLCDHYQGRLPLLPPPRRALKNLQISQAPP